MSSYVLSTGFKKKTYNEIQQELTANFVTAFGQNIDLDPTGPFGQIIALNTKALADLWDLAEEVYYSRDPDNATGIALDAICAETGVRRIAAAKSVVDMIMTGSRNVTIAAGKKVKNPLDSLLWSLIADVQLGVTNLHAAVVTCESPAAGKVYTITLAAQAKTFIAAASDTKTSVLTNLMGQLQAQFPALTFAVASEKLYICYTSALVVNPASASFSLVLSNTMSEISVSSRVTASADETGAKTAAAGSLTAIATPVTGWTAAYNVQPATAGRDTETDAELRLRRSQVFFVGKSTEDSIRNALLSQIEGIASVQVISNRTAAVVDGQDPHSFECVVVGGTAAASQIAQVIWNTMPAGIKAYGRTPSTQNIPVIDAAGKTQYVSYSTPQIRYLWVRVVRTAYAEEVYAGDEAVKQSLINFSLKEYNLGKDVIPQRLAQAVFGVSGTATAVVSVRTTATANDDSTPYTQSPISVGNVEQAVLHIARIEVITQ